MAADPLIGLDLEEDSTVSWLLSHLLRRSPSKFKISQTTMEYLILKRTVDEHLFDPCS